MTATSKFAYKAKPKQCIHLATIQICLPYKQHQDHTDIAFAKLCEFCVLRITKIKAAALMQFKIREVSPIVPPARVHRDS